MKHELSVWKIHCLIHFHYLCFIHLLPSSGLDNKFLSLFDCHFLVFSPSIFSSLFFTMGFCLFFVTQFFGYKFRHRFSKTFSTQSTVIFKAFRPKSNQPNLKSSSLKSLKICPESFRQLWIPLLKTHMPCFWLRLRLLKLLPGHRRERNSDCRPF